MFRERMFVQALEQFQTTLNIPLRMVLWDGREYVFSDSADVVVRLNGTQAAQAFAKPNLLTLAEAYIRRQIDIDGPIDKVIQVAASLAAAGRRSAALTALLGFGTRHNKADDRASIAYHYDVSNAFYQTWLDRRMVYSCAYYHHPEDSLEAAQEQKLDLICRKLRLQPGDRFLDVGCGWGALVIHAAERYGVDATGITLSQRQYELANERIREQGLQDRCRVLLEDYRDHRTETPYDKAASVGMFEHVGLANLPLYFGTVNRLLRDGGIFLNHGITAMSVDNAAVGLGAGEFIDRYVFPNGELPHLHLAVRDMSAGGFEVVDVEGLRPHYALTLAEWSRRFEANLDRLRSIVPEETVRVWRVYLAGCAHAFRQGWISIHQVLGAKRGDGPDYAFPLTRKHHLQG